MQILKDEIGGVFRPYLKRSLAYDVEILKEFFRIRFRIYEKRLEYIKGELQAEIQDLENKVNFCEVFHTLKSHEKTKKEVVAVLRQLNFVPDPTKAFQAQWKAQRKRDEVAEFTVRDCSKYVEITITVHKLLVLIDFCPD